MPLCWGHGRSSEVSCFGISLRVHQSHSHELGSSGNPWVNCFVHLQWTHGQTDKNLVVKGQCDLTKCVFGHDSRIPTLIMTHFLNQIQEQKGRLWPYFLQVGRGLRGEVVILVLTVRPHSQKNNHWGSSVPAAWFRLRLHVRASRHIFQHGIFNKRNKWVLLFDTR